MQVLQGIAVSPGVAIGEALIIDAEGFRIPRRFVRRDAVDAEIARLDEAIGEVATEIARHRDDIAAQIGPQYAAIFSAHLEMVRDPKLHSELVELIRGKHYTPEYAVSRTFRRYANVFAQLDSGFLAERAHDIHDLEKHLLANLLGRQREELAHITSPVVVLAHNLTPSETARLDPKRVLAMVTEVGGPGSHTAIVAEGLEIPSVVGVGRLTSSVAGGEKVIVDGDTGRVIFQPDSETLDRYIREVEKHRSLAIRLEGLSDLPAVTRDQVSIQLMANIEFPYEAETCVKRGAQGVGLYRTEFLYLGTRGEPSEEEHTRTYEQVVRTIRPHTTVIRTLDLGADKMGQLPRAAEDTNPFLGLRSIRLSLRNIPQFRIQLRAILRASVHGPVRVMFPMITTLAELRQAKMVLADAMEDLAEEKVPFDEKVPVGMMVEVPAAVTMLDRFLPEVDFISIGTNDLIQYALAVDRNNKEVADLYQACEPAVLRLIRASVQEADRFGRPASACGQMSGTLAHALLLMGLGVRILSVTPSALPEIRMLVRSVTMERCRTIAERALEMESAREIDSYLREELKREVPELMAARVTE